ncbi:MAG: DEAD/DEAH box helicase [Bacillota bacterium]|nr:DEAD/DEAH box helicase [Bacillota bacterium]
MYFEELSLKPALKKAVDKLGYKEMFLVQEELWNTFEDQKDCIVLSKTGSGKTLAYALPILNQIDINEKRPQAIVLCPTRELARQVKDVIDDVGRLSSVKTSLLIGKESFELQRQDLNQRCHIVLGTPGRVIEHINSGNLITDKVNYLVLDEADEMLNQDFENDMLFIKEQLQSNVQTCLISATYSNTMEKFTNGANKIEVESVNTQIKEWGFKVEGDKKNFLIKVLIEYLPESCLVFVSTQKDVEEMYSFLKENNCSVEKIHGGMNQEERFFAFDQFKKGKVRLLVATDVASRGIDIDKVDMIINYDLSKSKTLHTHRIGRSGRAFETGCAITFFEPEEKNHFDLLEIQEKEFVFSKSMEDLKQLSVSTKIYVDKSESLNKEFVTLFLNVGKNKKIRPGDILGALCQLDGIQMEDIGAIKVESNQSFVDVFNGKEKSVLNSLKNVKKKSVRVELAKRRK